MCTEGVRVDEFWEKGRRNEQEGYEVWEGNEIEMVSVLLCDGFLGDVGGK